MRIHVAGAGAFGLACAVRLARAGARVTVFDPALEGVNASGIAAGMLAPVFEAALDAAAHPHFALLYAARDHWPQFSIDYGVELDQRGALFVDGAEALDRLSHHVGDLGVRVERLGRRGLDAVAPGLSPALQDGLLTAEDWRIDAALTLADLRRAAAELGVQFRAEAVRGAGDADRLVIATGAAMDLRDLVPELSLLTPIKGHILRFAPRGYGGVVLRGPGAYAVPGSAGLAVGATMEAGVADRTIDPARVAALRAGGAALLPALAGEAASAFAGVRAATPDGLPLVGPSMTPSILLAVGARRNGWLLAPLVSQIVTAYAMDADPGPWAASLHPARGGGQDK